jgi:hypothetical protein
MRGLRLFRLPHRRPLWCSGRLGIDALDERTLPSSGAIASLVAAPDSYYTGQNTQLKVTSPGVLANDTDPDGDPLAAALESAPADGTLLLNPDGSFIYTPNRGFRGTDSFTYWASDPSAASSTATVTIRVIPSSGRPVAENDSYTVGEDAELDVAAPGVLTNDTPPDNLSLTAEFVSGPSYGTLTFHSDGSFIYIPTEDFVGTDEFVYKAVDANARLSGAAHVTITVTATEGPPVALPDAFSTSAGVPLRVTAAGVLANDSATDGDPLTSVLVAIPAHGSLTLNSDGSLVYMPAAGFSGTDTFTYEARAGSQVSAAVAVTITVRPSTPPKPTPTSTSPPSSTPTPTPGQPIPGSPGNSPTPPVVVGGPTATPVGITTLPGNSKGSSGPVLALPPTLGTTVLGFGSRIAAGYASFVPEAGTGRAAAEVGPAPTVVPPPATPPPTRPPSPVAVPPSHVEVQAGPVPRPVDEAPVTFVVPPVPALRPDDPVFTGIDDVKQDVARPKRVQVAAGTAVGTGMALTAGTVLFSPRLAYWFLSALLARRTVWKPFDPLEVMYAWDREHGSDGPDADDDSLKRMVG